MKKLATLLLAAGMVVAASAPANAVDVKVDARYRASFAYGSNGFNSGNVEDLRHRFRLGLTMAASENLSAFVQFQANQANQWGNTDQHGLGAANDVQARMMFLDWVVPGTPVKVRMGRHDLGLPAEAFGENSILGGGWGNREGIVVTAPVADWLGLSAMWARLATDAGKDIDTNNTDDIYAVAANVKFDGISGAVYGAYATLDEGITGQNTWNGRRPEGSGNAYWLGFTSTFSAFDPFTLKVSAAFGEYDAENADQSERGWNVQAKASYALPFGTASLGGWYFSGEDRDGKGAMYAPGYFAGTKHYYDGFASLNNPHGCTQNTGTWAVQAALTGVSFIEKLSHDFQVTYMEGTNKNKRENLGGYYKDADATKGIPALTVFDGYANYLTEDDSLVEFSMVNTYKIYKNLAARLDLAYIISDLDSIAAKEGGLTEDDWHVGLTFDFKF